ncbi:MAG: DUF4830 domain-containing protein [Oscillospiraceae bacterium]|nr:DUF4830 domain-containing protein [Oscillospiraceae bacterium]
MFVMTAKVDKKKLAIVISAAVALIVILAVLLGGGKSATTGAEISVTSNEDRVRFLTGYGWEVVISPAETSQVRIPSESNEVFARYNTLQKTMGYDLSDYAGKTVMRYVYTIKNYPGATEPVYATLLIANNQVIGGDITDTAANGKIHGFEISNE